MTSLNAESLRKQLAGKMIGHRLYYYDEIGSTNDEAFRLGEEGAPEGTVLIAESQTSGKGRMQRVWYSPAGANIYTSMILRPLAGRMQATQIPIAAGVAAAETLNEFCPGKAWIKWPNDVLIHGKKVSGILTEIIWSGSSLESIILGIGVNFKSEAFIQAGELRFPATSLEAEGVEIDSLQDFLEQLLFFLRQRRQQLGSAQFLEDWNQKLAFRNQFMPITQYQGKTEMLCPGSINADGSLNARDQAGNWRVVYSSEFSDPSAGSSSLSTSSSEESSSS